MKKIRVQIVQPIAGGDMPEYDQENFSFRPGQVVMLHPVLAGAWDASGVCSIIPEGEADPKETQSAPNRGAWNW
jgi:hypothetical protein